MDSSSKRSSSGDEICFGGGCTVSPSAAFSSLGPGRGLFQPLCPDCSGRPPTMRNRNFILRETPCSFLGPALPVPRRDYIRLPHARRGRDASRGFPKLTTAPDLITVPPEGRFRNNRASAGLFSSRAGRPFFFSTTIHPRGDRNQDARLNRGTIYHAALFIRMSAAATGTVSAFPARRRSI